MYPQLVDLIRAGAIATVCKTHQKLGEKDRDWKMSREFIGRDFRSADPAVLDALIEKAKQAKCAAERFMDSTNPDCVSDCGIPKLEG